MFPFSQLFRRPDKEGDGHDAARAHPGKIVDLAKEELLGTKKSISEIAYQLGFQYSQHFNRYFKRNVGMSPSQYRKS